MAPAPIVAPLLVLQKLASVVAVWQVMLHPVIDSFSLFFANDCA